MAKRVCIPARSGTFAGADRSLRSQLHDASTPSPNHDLLSPYVLATGSSLSSKTRRGEVTIMHSASNDPCHVQRRAWEKIQRLSEFTEADRSDPHSRNINSISTFYFHLSRHAVSLAILRPEAGIRIFHRMSNR